MILSRNYIGTRKETCIRISDYLQTGANSNESFQKGALVSIIPLYMNISCNMLINRVAIHKELNARDHLTRINIV